VTLPNRRLPAATSILVFTTVICGCSSVASGDELFDQARAVYVDYRSAVAEVQLAI
jgi:hypothetical protein